MSDHLGDNVLFLVPPCRDNAEGVQTGTLAGDEGGEVGESAGSGLIGLIEVYTIGRLRRGEISRLTARNQRYALNSFATSLGKRAVSRISQTDVERWLAQGDYMPAAQRTRFSIVKNFTKWLAYEGHVRRDPCGRIRNPRQPRTVPVVFEPWEVAAILDACPDSRGRLIVLLECQLGLRCIEVSRLELGDITSRHVHVRGKSGNERIVPLVEEARVALNDYLKDRGGGAGPLIQNLDHPGRGLARSTISLYVNQWIRETGIKRFRYDGRSGHALRRTCASDMAEAGVPLLDVAEALGHVSTDTTKRHYIRYKAARLEQAMGGRWYGGRRQEAAG